MKRFIYILAFLLIGCTQNHTTSEPVEIDSADKAEIVSQFKELIDQQNAKNDSLFDVYSDIFTSMGISMLEIKHSLNRLENPIIADSLTPDTLELIARGENNYYKLLIIKEDD